MQKLYINFFTDRKTETLKKKATPTLDIISSSYDFHIHHCQVVYM